MCVFGDTFHEWKRKNRLDDVFRKVCRLGDVDTEALVQHAGLDLVQKRDIPVLRCFFLSDVCDDMQILHVKNLLVERCELVKVRCKETEPRMFEAMCSGIAHASSKPS